MAPGAFAIICATAIFLLSGIAPGSVNSPPTTLACPPFAGAALPLPTPRRDPHAIERFQQINDAVKAGPHAILFFGDSLTEKWDPSIWARDFAPRGALNAGVNGDRTEHLLWRLEHGNLEGQQPQAVVLLIGTNDIGRDRPPAVVANGIRAILEALGTSLPSARILLLGVLPRGESAGSPRRRQVREVNGLIRKCADGEHIFYADPGDALLDPDGRLTHRISPDGVHLSEPGYALLADSLNGEIGHLLAGDRPGALPRGQRYR